MRKLLPLLAVLLLVACTQPIEVRYVYPDEPVVEEPPPHVVTDYERYALYVVSNPNGVEEAEDIVIEEHPLTETDFHERVRAHGYTVELHNLLSPEEFPWSLITGRIYPWPDTY